MATPGARRWYIADAYLPSSGQGTDWPGHESICMLNVGDADAKVTFTLYFEDRQPMVIDNLTLKARSCWHARMDMPEQLGGAEVPRDVPYGVAVEADQPIVVQYSRLDVTQPNFTLMTTIPYTPDE